MEIELAIVNDMTLKLRLYYQKQELLIQFNFKNFRHSLVQIFAYKLIEADNNLG